MTNLKLPELSPAIYLTRTDNSDLGVVHECPTERSGAVEVRVRFPRFEKYMICNISLESGC